MQANTESVLQQESPDGKTLLLGTTVCFVQLQEQESWEL